MELFGIALLRLLVSPFGLPLLRLFEHPLLPGLVVGTLAGLLRSLLGAFEAGLGHRILRKTAPTVILIILGLGRSRLRLVDLGSRVGAAPAVAAAS